MKTNLNEQVSRIKKMMGLNEDFDISNPVDNSGTIVDCNINTSDSDTIEIDVIYDEEEQYETYLISVEFEYEEGEPQTYDYPGSSGGAYGSVNGVKMTYPEERMLTPEESETLLSNEHVKRCVSSTIEDMENNAYEGRDSGPDPDDYYDRMRDND